MTGFGIVGPYGDDPVATFDALFEGRSAIRVIDDLVKAECPCTVGAPVLEGSSSEFLSDRSSLRQLRSMDPVHSWALRAAMNAAAHANLLENVDGAWRSVPALNGGGIAVGTGLSGRASLDATFEQFAHRTDLIPDSSADHVQLRALITRLAARELNPMLFLQQCPSLAAAQVAIRLGLRGPNLTYMSLCAASAQAIGEAAWAIGRGDVDVMLAGGADSMLHPVDTAAFYALGAVTGSSQDGERACKPFDRRRDGCVLGEGAAFLVLEAWDHARERGTPIHAELTGYGTSHDAYKLSAPPEDGAGAFSAMRSALARSGLAPEQIDHINAHGTGTLLNDPIETTAIRAVFGQHADNLTVVATKSLVGHWIAGAGAMEAIVSVLTLCTNRVHPTLNLTEPDPRCDLDYVPLAGRDGVRVDSVLSNSFAIGGVNAALIFSSPDL